jgi:hypothetical protein
MFKRLLVILTIAAAGLAACSPAGGASGEPTLEPTMVAPSDALPSESMGTESAAPSAS